MLPVVGSVCSGCVAKGPAIKKVYIFFNFFFSVFQDLNVMVFLGFGFLSTFLVRYGFSSSGFNLLIAVIGTQWALLLNGFESWYYRGKIRIDLNRYCMTFYFCIYSLTHTCCLRNII